MAVLADAALDDDERAVLERFVVAVIDEYSEDLDGVWLYGCRARGERRHDESDIDVLVVTTRQRDDMAIYAMLHRVLNDWGNPRVLLEPRQRSRAWIEDRRAIESFFLPEVDRDKTVLYGRP
jgi:predicted nucleotidyltransferase